MMDVFTNLVSRIVSQKYKCLKAYQNVFFTYVQFVHASFYLHRGGIREQMKKKKWAEAETE